MTYGEFWEYVRVVEKVYRMNEIRETLNGGYYYYKGSLAKIWKETYDL
jgi:hypothetical protein